MSVVAAPPQIDPRSYAPHALHVGGRTWAESNCYIDLWIEILHAFACEPRACLSFVVAVDWEGDQFTFFKPPHTDLYELYGLDVQELTIYKPLVENATTQLAEGKLVLTEADAFFLPDTSGTDYRKQHVKTTIGIQAIDTGRKTLGYFHNGGYHTLADADFVGLFRLDVPPDPVHMPFFAELVRTRRVVRLEPRELARRAVGLLRKHLARRPHDNPIRRFGRSFPEDVAALRGQGLAAYHAYAFATIRQLGAAFELGAVHLRWLEQQGIGGLEPAAARFDAVSTTSKSLILKAARAVAANKSVDLMPMIREIEAHWEVGIDALLERFESTEGG